MPGVLLVAILAGCGGRADVDVSTVPPSGSFGARQTELAADGATRAASEPTATVTPAPTVRPSATPLPTVTPGGESSDPVPTTDGTRTSVVGVPETPTPEPTREDIAMAVITGCGTEPITIQVGSEELQGRIDEWQRMGEASQAIFEAWDQFYSTFGDFILYNQVVNNTEVFEGAAAFQAVADEHLPTLREIEDSSPFYDLAQTIVGTTEDQIAVSQLLTQAGTQHDQSYWDQALEISSTFEQQAQDFSREYSAVCDYWSEQQ
ncbi:MAG: hypothetical protein R2849_11715 [Thermomicrobiales bacterium]